MTEHELIHLSHAWDRVMVTNDCPTRNAGRHVTAPMYSIRPGRPEDVPYLPAVERAAALLFRTYPDLGIPEGLYDQPTSIETLAAAQKAGRLWIASDSSGNVVGFALVVVIDGCAHLDELDVLPSVGRQGIGSALVSAVCQWAADAGYPAVTLRTFRDVAWNARSTSGWDFRSLTTTPCRQDSASSRRKNEERGSRPTRG